MDIRLKWEPENKTPLEEIESQLASYVIEKSGVSLLSNGTALFIIASDNDENTARKAIEQAKFLADFEVVELQEGGYLVVFHDAVASFVGEKEFLTQKEEIIKRIDELKLPEEKIIPKKYFNKEHYLIGLYGRGKMYRDAHCFSFFKRIPGGRDKKK